MIARSTRLAVVAGTGSSRRNSPATQSATPR